MRKLLARALFASSFVITSVAGGGIPKPPATQVLNQDYTLALSAVDRFLCAWQMRRQDEGLSLLSPRLRGEFAEEELRSYISGISNPHHAAFEVGPGKRISEDRFAFDVRFYEHYTGEKEQFSRPRSTTISVVRVGPEDWLIDELPGLLRGK